MPKTRPGHPKTKSLEKRLFDKARYTARHRRARQRWSLVVRQGGVRCARASGCLFAEDGLGGLILPHEPWDLGHSPEGETWGPEHRRCNRATAGRSTTERTNSREW